MNEHEAKIFEHLKMCDQNESYLNSITRNLSIDKTDAMNALKLMTNSGILVKRKDGKKIIYKINQNYKDHLLELLDSFESRITYCEQEINKSIKYLRNKKLFIKDLKFTNKIIKQNVEAIIRFNKSIVDIVLQTTHIETFSSLDNDYIRKTNDIKKIAFETVKNTIMKFKRDHSEEQEALATYLEFQIHIPYSVM